MPRGKYNTHVYPRLPEIAAWCRKGVIDRDIAKSLGVSYSAFRDYVSKHEELAAALIENKGIVNATVESALLKRARGYEYEEVKCKYEGEELMERVVTVKSVPPDVSAISFWLRNRDPNSWSERIDSHVSGDIGLDLGEDTIRAVLKAAGYA